VVALASGVVSELQAAMVSVAEGCETGHDNAYPTCSHELFPPSDSTIVRFHRSLVTIPVANANQNRP